jgi:hypothetical protein
MCLGGRSVVDGASDHELPQLRALVCRKSPRLVPNGRVQDTSNPCRLSDASAQVPVECRRSLQQHRRRYSHLRGHSRHRRPSHWWPGHRRGGVFTDLGLNLNTNRENTTSPLTALNNRLLDIFKETEVSANKFVAVVFEAGDLPQYPPWLFSSSHQYNLSLAQFFDQGKFLITPDYTTLDQLGEQMFTHITATLTGTAVLEANYYILKGAYSTDGCPVAQGQTGMVINNACYSLEAPGPDFRNIAGRVTKETFSAQMAPDTVNKLTQTYLVNLKDLYTSSEACQISSQAYSTPLDMKTYDPTTASMPPCFYNLPVFTVGNDQIDAVFDISPCAVLHKNLTAPGGAEPAVGLTYLPDHLDAIFRAFGFCATHTPGIPEDEQTGA